jgi:hypothetical protein
MYSSLTSHEDLTPYIQQLSKIESTSSLEAERRRSFASEPETIIKELLTEVMSSRKYTKQATSIAEKFLEAYNNSAEDCKRLAARNAMLEENVEELSEKIQKNQKEMENQENRYESIALEATEMERTLKILNNECGQLKKERDFLKNQIASKEQTTIIKENSLQQRQKLYIEVEKESDKALQAKYNTLVLETSKKQSEIEELTARVFEIENLLSKEKNNCERLKSELQQLRTENSAKKAEIKALIEKTSEIKDKLKMCQEELIFQKNFNESLTREYEKNRRSTPRESLEITDDTAQAVNALVNGKPETLGAYMDQLEPFNAKPTENQFFIFSSTSTELSSPKVTLYNPKDICRCENISIQRTKPKNTNQEADPSLINNTQLINLVFYPSIAFRASLSIEKIEPVSISKPGNVYFDEADAASINSNDTEASHKERKASVLENRDPIKDFFVFVRNI